MRLHESLPFYWKSGEKWTFFHKTFYFLCVYCLHCTRSNTISSTCRHSVRTNWNMLKIQCIIFHLSKNIANSLFWCVNFWAWHPRELNCYPATSCLWLRYCADQCNWGSYRAVRTTWRPAHLVMWHFNDWLCKQLNYYFHMQAGGKGGGSKGGNELNSASVPAHFNLQIN